MANRIHVIKPYKWESLWVFDDPRVGLVREPFVGGADTIIDAAVAAKGIKNPNAGFLALFSEGPFPGADMELTWQRHEGGGDVYRWEGQNMEGWLCPALLKYFPTAPKKIHVQLRTLS